MNIQAINPPGFTTLWEFFALTMPLMVLSIYIIVGYQIEFKEPRPKPPSEIIDDQQEDFSDQMTVKKLTVWNRVFWPVVLARVLLERMKKTKNGKSVLGLPS